MVKWVFCQGESSESMVKLATAYDELIFCSNTGTSLAKTLNYDPDLTGISRV
jgi:hypothetical protein